VDSSTVIERREEMKRKIWVAIILLSTTEAIAFDFMGPTTSKLKVAGRSNVAIEYFWSNMEIDADGISELGLTSDTMEDVKFNKVTADFALGMGDSSEIFLRLGIAEAKPDKGDNQDNVAGYMGSSDECLLVGGGAKWTLVKGRKINWGLLAQVSWVDFDFDQRSYSINAHSVNFSTDMEIVEAQIATGPTFQPTSNIVLYGGPFLYFLSGDADLKGTIDGSPSSVSPDLEQESILGAYIGAQILVRQNADFNVEFQATSGNYGVGCQFVWRF
jgi:hypothetical protein